MEYKGKATKHNSSIDDLKKKFKENDIFYVNNYKQICTAEGKKIKFTLNSIAVMYLKYNQVLSLIEKWKKQQQQEKSIIIEYNSKIKLIFNTNKLENLEKDINYYIDVEKKIKNIPQTINEDTEMRPKFVSKKIEINYNESDDFDDNNQNSNKMSTIYEVNESKISKLHDDTDQNNEIDFSEENTNPNPNQDENTEITVFDALNATSQNKNNLSQNTLRLNNETTKKYQIIGKREIELAKTYKPKTIESKLTSSYKAKQLTKTVNKDNQKGLAKEDTQKYQIIGKREIELAKTDKPKTIESKLTSSYLAERSKEDNEKKELAKTDNKIPSRIYSLKTTSSLNTIKRSTPPKVIIGKREIELAKTDNKIPSRIYSLKTTSTLNTIKRSTPPKVIIGKREIELAKTDKPKTIVSKLTSSYLAERWKEDNEKKELAKTDNPKTIRSYQSNLLHRTKGKNFSKDIIY